MSTAEHEAVVEAKTPQAEALAEADVRKADRPIGIVLEEGFAFVRAARGVRVELQEVGLRPEAIEDYEGFLFALMSSHVLTAGARSNRRSEAGRLAVSEGRAVLADVGAAARLVLRGTPVAARVVVLVGGTQEAELVPGLNELASIVLAGEAAFTAKRFEAGQLAGRLVAVAERVRAALAEEEALRRLSDRYDLRDRLYTLGTRCLDEIRAHAEYAFRHEPGGRRDLFTSEHARARSRRYQNKQKAGAELRVSEPEEGRGGEGRG